MLFKTKHQPYNCGYHNSICVKIEDAIVIPIHGDKVECAGDKVIYTVIRLKGSTLQISKEGV